MPSMSGDMSTRRVISASTITPWMNSSRVSAMMNSMFKRMLLNIAQTMSSKKLTPAKSNPILIMINTLTAVNIVATTLKTGHTSPT